jgi:nickel/cobalt transporter (NicO) family protein
MAGFDVWVFSALAVGLGVKHAFDADHVLAISNLLTRSGRMERSLTMAGSWALGHMVTAAIVSALVFFFADTVLPALTSRLEVLVPLLLILVGAFGLFGVWRRVHVHRHEHGERAHRHVHVHVRSRRHEHGAMAGIGVVHGLASNDELLAVLVVGLAADSWWQVLLGVGLFSLGVLLGMIVYAAAVHAAASRPRTAWIPTAMTVVFSLASLVYAAYLLTGGQGLNLLPSAR